MDLGLAGKKVIVTGGASGIGAAIVRTFAEEGAVPLAVDINGPGLDKLGEDLAKSGFHLEAVVADLSRMDGITGAVAAATKVFGGAPDILVNNVGAGTLRTLEETTDEQFHSTMELNFFAMVRMCKLVVPEMKKNGGGAVVSVTSDLSRQQEDTITDYAASKAAVAAVSKSLSRQYAPSVRLNCVAPGPILTPFWEDENYGWMKTVEQAYGKKGLDAIQALIDDRGIPMGRIGQPEEVAAAVAFLASAKSGFTTGATLGVDGGSIRSIF